MADYAHTRGTHVQLGEAQRQVEAQKQAMAEMQAELQQKDIDLQARARELTARERKLEKREADVRTLSVRWSEEEQHKTQELQAGSERLGTLQAELDARAAALAVHFFPRVLPM
jgi:septal ring factor EnvC (AmiA/AmiB activator)